MTYPVLPKKDVKSRKKIIIYTLLSVIVIGVLLSSIFIYSIMSNKKIYEGVLINDVNVSHMLYDDAINLLESKYTDKLSGETLILKFQDSSLPLKFSDMKVSYQIRDAVDKAYKVGRTGNLFSRLYNIFDSRRNNAVIELSYSYDNNYADDSLEKFYSETLIPVKESDLFLGESEVTISSGNTGKSIEKQKTLEIIENSIKTCTGGTFEVPVKLTMPSNIDSEKVYQQITLDPKDAKIIVEDNIVTFDAHIVGRKIDKAELINVLNNFRDSTETTIKLPVEFIEPEITIDYLSNNLFKDVLGSSTTRFTTNNTNNANRGVNIRLASAKINGKILQPDEVFSFNDHVGPRTSAGGYKAAHAYMNGKIVDDVGGGICQVSTTLYNSVLFADLEAVDRRNHMFTVGYVPLGRDAAVSYGDTDFKFRNNSKWPVKIESSVSKDNSLVFVIKGTNEKPEKTIEITHVAISSTPAPVKYIDDPTLEVGKTVVITSGMSGHVVDTYKIVKLGHEVISKTFLHRSTYRTYAKQVKRGTKVVAPTIPSTSPDAELPSPDYIDMTLQ